MSYQKDVGELVKILAREGIPHAAELVEKLRRLAQRYKRLAERECNGDDWRDGGSGLVACPNREKWNNGYCHYCGSLPPDRVHGRVSRSSLRMERIEAEVAKLLPVSWRARWSGDPRGAVLKLALPSGETNDWGREGICVPTRY